MSIVRPVIVIGAPRSGTTLLYSILSSHPQLWSLYNESYFLEKYFHPAKFEWVRGNALAKEDATPEVIHQIRKGFYLRAINYQLFIKNSISKIYTGNQFIELVLRRVSQFMFLLCRHGNISLVEKTPKNCLRVPFLDTIFPDAYFVFLTRAPFPNISSLLEGWRLEGKFRTYQIPGGLQLRDYSGLDWKFLLPPGWEEFATGHSLAEVCAFQYKSANQEVLNALDDIPKHRKAIVKYESLVENPKKTILQLCEGLKIPYIGGMKMMAEQLPPVNTEFIPNKEKWKKNEQELLSVRDDILDIAQAMGYIV